MPELPEVETTVRALNRTVRGLSIEDVWSDYNSPFHKGKSNIKDVAYFALFKKAVAGKKIASVERRAKNILINLTGGQTVLVHMKMTGHFLYGRWKKTGTMGKTVWKPLEPETVKEPMNRFIHFVLILSNGKMLAFSDLRRFAKILHFPTSETAAFIEREGLGPEPLVASFNLKRFKERLNTKPTGKIKQVLMDQSVIAGIGNIYSDEILWAAGVHPFSTVKNLPEKSVAGIYRHIRKILPAAIRVGGDSISDFRQLDGTAGGYQGFHKAYHRTGERCEKTGCGGTIVRLKLGGRSAHFCNRHQKRY